jgi:hypothetical protein
MHVVTAKGKNVPYVQIVVRGRGGIKRQVANSQGLALIELPRGEYMAQLATLPIANRPEVQESRQPFHVTQRWGVQKIVLTLK